MRTDEAGERMARDDELGVAFALQRPDTEQAEAPYLTGGGRGFADQMCSPVLVLLLVLAEQLAQPARRLAVRRTG